jgi:tRNA A-37 threonylcarbamoyl transferase component Bud32
LAVDILDEVIALAQDGINHGDLHTSSILVQVPDDKKPYADFRIIDFGTSLFAAKQDFSIQRHWATFTETMDRLLYPFACSRGKRPPLLLKDGPNAIGR